MSRYDGTDTYTYPGSSVLCNRAGLHDQALLEAFEADATAVRLLELYQNPIPGKFDLPHLQAIHRHLFQDVYVWAGELRTVDISKGPSRFANWPQIEPYLGRTLSGIAAEQWLRTLDPESFIVRMAHYMGEINAVHPFRDGNGRAQRVFCAQLADEAGYFVDFAAVERDEMYAAMVASFNGDDRLLVQLLARIVSMLA